MFKNRKSGIDNLDDNVLQAVIIIDSFTQNLIPFCDYMSSSLIPLANRPLLEYTLDCLVSSGVQEAILFCSSFADQVNSFIREEKWPELSITVVISEGCRSFGDVMRDLDTKALIRSDFILLTGNIVGNLQLLPALEAHKRFQKSDKGAAMTLIFKECGKRCKPPEDEFVVALDARTKRVILYNKKLKNPGKIDIPVEMVLDTPEIELRCDLWDTQVSICSVAVPPLFSDNFDFQTREDFVRGLLVDEEVLTSTIYTYLLPHTEYAATVNSWANYQDITHDLIHRWVYPFAPDTIMDDPYSFQRHNIYTQRNISLSQGCKLEEDVVIASDTSVGQNSFITRSVIGKMCRIGSNVVINDAFIMDNTTIKDNCRISYSVVGPGCCVEAGATVTDGSVLAIGVIIEAGKNISHLKLQAFPSPRSNAEDAVCSQAYLYKSCEDEDSDSDSENEEVVTGLRINRSDVDEDWEDSSDSDDEETRSMSPVPEDTNLFYTEVIDSLVRGYEDKLLCDNLVLEINSSRYAYNVSMSEVNFHVVRALLTLPQPDGNLWQQLVSRLAYFTPILTNYIRSTAAQRDCLLAIEDVAGSHPEIFDVLVKVIHWLYEQDILSEDSIFHWYNNPCAEPDLPNAKRVRNQVAPFIKWLKEAEEQSSEDDDEDDD